jgi:hypothetical protein
MNIDIEAARKLAADIGLRPAARHYGIDHNKLRRLLSKLAPQQESEAAPQAAPEDEPSSSFWSTIRRHENHTRNLLGLPPLTDAQWAEERKAVEKCREEMDRFWGPRGWHG